MRLVQTRAQHPWARKGHGTHGVVPTDEDAHNDDAHEANNDDHRVEPVVPGSCGSSGLQPGQGRGQGSRPARPVGVVCWVDSALRWASGTAVTPVWFGNSCKMPTSPAADMSTGYAGATELRSGPTGSWSQAPCVQ